MATLACGRRAFFGLLLFCCSVVVLWLFSPYSTHKGLHDNRGGLTNRWDLHFPNPPLLFGDRLSAAKKRMLHEPDALQPAYSSHRWKPGHDVTLKPNGTAVDSQELSAESALEEYRTILSLYLTKLKNAHVRAADIAFNACLSDGAAEVATVKPCPVKDCHVSFPEPEERLGRILSTQFPVEHQYLNALDNHVNNQSEYADIVFIHASSANHYEESLGVVLDLKEKVFPQLRRQNSFSFKFFYYDLGLHQSQIKQLEKICGCTVKQFPFDKLPKRFRKVNSYAWKPLLFKIHLAHSKYTVWLDACVRFKTGDLAPIMDKVDKVGVFTARSNFFMLPHTHPVMLEYFQLQPCQLAPFYETETGFVVMKNDAFVRRAIMDSWLACSFSSNCLCPDYDGGDCRKFWNCDVTPRQTKSYQFMCHRYDQSALGAILVSLFELRATGVGLRNVDKNTNQFYTFAKK